MRFFLRNDNNIPFPPKHVNKKDGDFSRYYGVFFFHVSVCVFSVFQAVSRVLKKPGFPRFLSRFRHCFRTDVRSVLILPCHSSMQQGIYVPFSITGPFPDCLPCIPPGFLSVPAPSCNRPTLLLRKGKRKSYIPYYIGASSSSHSGRHFPCLSVPTHLNFFYHLGANYKHSSILPNENGRLSLCKFKRPPDGPGSRNRRSFV